MHVGVEADHLAIDLVDGGLQNAGGKPLGQRESRGDLIACICIGFIERWIEREAAIDAEQARALVEDAVRAANDGLVRQPVGETEARRKVGLIKID